MSSNHHGLLLVNKPSGCTSHDVVASVRRVYKTKEVGHSGTLDPLASGLMVLLVGEATKLSSYITEGDKSYRVDLRLGFETDTLDTTGMTVFERKVESSLAEIQRAALGLTGDLHLKIPMYSAKKIDGKKLYEYARESIEIQVPSKNMRFWSIEDLSEENKISFHLHCSKGSFIRSWVKELGERLGCGATMSGLVRTTSHRFRLSDAVDLDVLQSAVDPEKYLVSMTTALPEVKRIKVQGQEFNLLRNGQISHQLRSRLIILFDPSKDQFVQIMSPQNKMLALVGIEEGKGFKIKRVFN